MSANETSNDNNQPERPSTIIFGRVASVEVIDSPAVLADIVARADEQPGIAEIRNALSPRARIDYDHLRTSLARNFNLAHSMRGLHIKDDGFKTGGGNAQVDLIRTQMDGLLNTSHMLTDYTAEAAIDSLRVMRDQKMALSKSEMGLLKIVDGLKALFIEAGMIEEVANEQVGASVAAISTAIIERSAERDRGRLTDKDQDRGI